MITSGEHALWDARMAWAPLLATPTPALTKIGQALQRVVRSYVIAADRAAVSLAAFGRTYCEHMERVGKQLQAAAPGSNWTANRTTPPKTPIQHSGGEG